jgi:hypothetical protein
MTRWLHVRNLVSRASIGPENLVVLLRLPSKLAQLKLEASDLIRNAIVRHALSSANLIDARVLIEVSHRMSLIEDTTDIKARARKVLCSALVGALLHWDQLDSFTKHGLRADESIILHLIKWSEMDAA